ncbi:hypothetical protein [Massilia sp. H6]|uniref:hypothetical protein n=1 Tax=Massilia sp. H6 TaxID=2970464 RepID=UPI002166F702|nr:hypothetical protein [Massilia sp. H6]UVW28399.1 hypothetical protein NRS07_18055 [Massilia sp. H6]
MKTFLAMALGGAAGTLIYTGWISSAQELDWGRALFVGIAVGFGAIFWPQKKANQATHP